MKLVLPNIRLPFDHDDDAIIDIIAKKFRISKKIITNVELEKKSVDARKKPDISFVYTFVVSVKGNLNENTIKKAGATVFKYKGYKFPFEKIELSSRPIIVGAGPAGLFCAYVLAKEGYNPIILERGEEASKRHLTIQEFIKTGKLNVNSNITFGEGGAGTYSDGKLSTGVKDKFLRKQLILDTLVEFGADPSILYMSKPHVGTDYLVNIVENMRKEIIRLGGQVHFNTLVTDVVFDDTKTSIQGVIVNEAGEIKEYASDQVVFAIGHSSRDTFEALHKREIQMESKPYAIGVRIEHPQEWIDRSQYGEKHYEDTRLPVADYKLTYQSPSGRGVYTFCMCPGGFVVNSSSSENMLVCNGMSLFDRDNFNANSAIIVTVTQDDFVIDGIKDESPLAGIRFQEHWERKAFEISNSYAMPTQSFEEFYADVKGEAYENTKYRNNEFFDVEEVDSTCTSALVVASIKECLPTFVAEGIIEGVLDFGKKIEGFDHPKARLVGVETRTSSPVKILRDESFMSSIKGLYPCGEGAGYAGGIMSAAIDGIKVAEKMVENSTN